MSVTTSTNKKVNKLHDVLAEYHEAGLCVVPGHKGKKYPIHNGWEKSTYADQTEPQLYEWADEYKGCNWCCVTGGRNGYIVIDIDNKDGKDGDGDLRNLIAEHGALPATWTVRTPTGGRHLYFAVSDPEGEIVNSAGTLADGIDIRGQGGQVVMPPSSIDGKPYRWLKGRSPKSMPHMAPLPPNWHAAIIANQVRTTDIVEREPRVASGEPVDDVTDAMLKYWISQYPHCIDGCGGNDATMQFARRLYECWGLDSEQYRDYLWYANEVIMDPPWVDHDLERIACKIESTDIPEVDSWPDLRQYNQFFASCYQLKAYGSNPSYTVEEAKLAYQRLRNGDNPGGYARYRRKVMRGCSEILGRKMPKATERAKQLGYDTGPIRSTSLKKSSRLEKSNRPEKPDSSRTNSNSKGILTSSPDVTDNEDHIADFGEKVLTNYTVAGTTGRPVYEPIPDKQIVNAIRGIFDDRLVCLDGLLSLITEDATIQQIKSSQEFFGHIRRRGYSVDWRRGHNLINQEGLYEYIKQMVPQKSSVAYVPHYIPRKETYYINKKEDLPEATGEHLAGFLDLFNPSTPLDRELIKTMVLSLVLGGDVLLPCFLIDSDEGVSAGRAVGKTSLVQAMASLISPRGEYYSFPSSAKDVEEIKKGMSHSLLKCELVSSLNMMVS